MNAPNTVYVIGTFPDSMNTNRNIREYIVEGMIEALPEGKVFDVSQEMFQATVEPRQGDLCLFVGSVLKPSFDVESLIWRAGRNGAKCAIWLHDDPYEYDASWRVVEGIDAIFTNDRSSVYHYPDGAPACHLPMAASRRYASEPLERSSVDFFFAGVPYNNRAAFFRRLDNAMVNAWPVPRGMIVGPNWQLCDFPNAIDLRIDSLTLMDFYKSALTTIYLGRDYDLLNRRFGVRPSTPGPRLFEAAGAGACQIVVTPGLEVLEYFAPGEEIIFAESAAEAAEAIQALRGDRARSLSIGRKAQKRVLGEHLYLHRAQTILSFMAQL